MPNTDHRLGYAPAMHEDFQAPEWWGVPAYPLGIPSRDWSACVNETRGWRPEGRYVTSRSSQCMTRGDVVGLEPQEGPQPAPQEPNAPKVRVMVPNGAGLGVLREPVGRGMRYSPEQVAQGALQMQVLRGHALHEAMRGPEGEQVRRPTLSPAAEWPFAGLGAQCERVRLEKLKEAEHAAWMRKAMRPAAEGDA